MEKYLSTLKGDMNEILRLSDRIKKSKHYLAGMYFFIKNFHKVNLTFKSSPLTNKKCNSWNSYKTNY
jgi:hypothetical protein